MVWPRNQPTPNVFELLQPGLILTVQVMKDMLGTKGARLSTDLSIPSRYLVLMPYGNHIGVSQRIESEDERNRLRSIIERIQAEHKLPGSVIVRTAAMALKKKRLHRIWLIWLNSGNTFSVNKSHCSAFIDL